ncbi:hypothetical protein FB451DRAFT_1551214 [Mycena latifolia]|nr:hypothetical protein FB451DRAFT_1551214 [Mycena latifolia]
MKKDPATFHSGDVVEMGFAIVAFKQVMRGGDPDKHVCKLVLRTLTVLDSSLSKAAFQARMSGLSITKDIPALKERPKESLVRTRAFVELDSDEEEEADARQQMANMRITGEVADADMSSSVVPPMHV